MYCLIYITSQSLEAHSLNRQTSISGKCFKIFDEEFERKSLSDAKATCVSIGGSLVKITSRKKWWNIMKHVTGGWNSFWISENSFENTPTDTNSEDGSQIGLMNTFGLHKEFDGGILANLPKDYRQVPPQWNIVDRRQKHRFVCEI